MGDEVVGNIYCIAQSDENRGRGDKSTSELAREYLSRIDQKTFTDLIEVFRVDFEMFQYSPEGYYYY